MFRGFFSRFTGNTLYYPGCLTHFVLPEVEENYKKLLSLLGVDFIFVQEFNCCGSPAKNAGYMKDFDDLKARNMQLLKKYNVRKIITSCPACYKVFGENYPVEVEHITTVVAKNLKKVKAQHNESITYHDPCHLGRHSGIFEEPRVILKYVGFEVEELPENRKSSRCCGAGGGLKGNYPRLADDIAKGLLKDVKTKKLVTTCPMCYVHFKENAPGLEVLELSEVLL